MSDFQYRTVSRIEPSIKKVHHSQKNKFMNKDEKKKKSLSKKKKGHQQEKKKQLNPPNEFELTVDRKKKSGKEPEIDFTV